MLSLLFEKVFQKLRGDQTLLDLVFENRFFFSREKELATVNVQKAARQTFYVVNKSWHTNKHI